MWRKTSINKFPPHIKMSTKLDLCITLMVPAIWAMYHANTPVVIWGLGILGFRPAEMSCVWQSIRPGHKTYLHLHFMSDSITRHLGHEANQQRFTGYISRSGPCYQGQHDTRNQSFQVFMIMGYKLHNL